MINVSNDFKFAVRQPGKEIKAYLVNVGVYPDEITESDDLKSLKITASGDIIHTVMRQFEAEFFGAHNYLEEYVNVGVGVVLPDIVSLGTATISIAAPGVVSLTAHGLSTGDRIKFLTSGNLPTGLLPDTYYYVIEINANSFNVAATYEDSANDIKITTTGSQSGVHTLYSALIATTGDTEYIDYGTFKVLTSEANTANDGVKIKGFDKMYESLQAYDLEPIYDIVYPVTMLELLETICTRLDWTLATTSFPNDDIEIVSDLFLDQGLTFRNVLEMIAEASGSIMYFNVDDELVLRQVNVETELETLDSSDLKTLLVEAHYGEINSIILSRQPQEDNIIELDQASIDANGLTELKIVNNLITDTDRETYISPIADVLIGVDFYPFTATTDGLGYFELGDRLTMVDPAENEFEVIVLHMELEVTGGVKETLKAKRPAKTVTPYNTAGIIGQRIRNTEIIVDKQQGLITLINGNVTDGFAQLQLTDSLIIGEVNDLTEVVDDNTGQITSLEEQVATLELTATQLQVTIEGIGGTNKLKNSVGLKGNIVEWQLLDVDGDLIDPDNDGTIDQSTEVQNNSESGSAITIEEQFIEQTFDTIEGESYTAYFRYKSDGDCVLSITGLPDVTLDEESEFTVYKLPFIGSSSNTTFKLDNTADSGSSATFTDLVVKLGDANGWVQAPNEVYGSNYRFDGDGLSLTDPNSRFKVVITNESFTVYDTTSGSDVVVMQATKDLGLIKRLTAEESFILQRTGNPAAAGRMIPTTKGIMLTVNNS